MRILDCGMGASCIQSAIRIRKSEIGIPAQYRRCSTALCSMTQWNCLTCGAPLTVESRFARMVTCDFCGHVHLIHDDRLTDTGRVAHLVDIPSPLYIDATGMLLGRRFRVL